MKFTPRDRTSTNLIHGMFLSINRVGGKNLVLVAMGTQFIGLS